MAVSLRRCLLPPPAEVTAASELLMQAVRLHNSRDVAGAAERFRAANLEAIGAWFRRVVGPYDEAVHGPRPSTLNPPKLTPAERTRPRMLGVVDKRAIVSRDGYHCRFCEMPVLPKDTIKAIARCYPFDAPWTDVAAEQHAFFQAANLQYDHIVPHSRGGESNADNMVVTCAVCNYGRMSNTLEESHLFDPRGYPVRRSDWDGLQSFISTMVQ
jgi:hypothetical protein